MFAASTIMKCPHCISHQTTFTCLFQHIRNTPRAELHEKSNVSQTERCGSNTNRSWKITSGVVVSGTNRTTSERQVKYQARRLNSILGEQNTFSGAYGIHSRGQVVRESEILVITNRRVSDTPRHSACFLCRISSQSYECESIHSCRLYPSPMNGWVFASNQYNIESILDTDSNYGSINDMKFLMSSSPPVSAN